MEARAAEPRLPAAEVRAEAPGGVIAASLVLLALLAGIAGTTFGLIRAEHRRAEAEVARQGKAFEAIARATAEKA